MPRCQHLNHAPHFSPLRPSLPPCSTSQVGFLCPRHCLGRLSLRVRVVASSCAPLPDQPHRFISGRCFSTFPFLDFSDGILYDIPIIWLRLSLSRPSPRSWISNVMFVERL